MQIIRFIGTDGNAYWGTPADEGRARMLNGDLFGPLKFDDQKVAMLARLAPVDPPNIFAIGRNYREHAKEMNAKSELTEPLIFIKATSSVVGPDEEILLPASAPSEVDYEAELAVVIGRHAKNVSESDALEFVLGYTCANDVSARDCQQRRDKQWARGKSFDTFCPMGPTLTTADGINPSNLPVRSRLNGQIMQDSNTSEMIFSVPYLISYLSHQFTLLPGTVILTGTPAGVGAARTPPVFLRAGDEISVQIDGIGTLTNRVSGP